MPRLRWIFITACAALSLFIAGTAYFFEWRNIAYLKTAIEDRSLKLESMKRRIEEYREKITFYRTPEGIAHLAREQYNLAFPGERVYIVVRSSSGDITVRPSP